MDVLNYYVSLARVDVHLKLCPKHTTSIMTDQGNVNTEQVNNLHEAIKEENKGRIGLLELSQRALGDTVILKKVLLPLAQTQQPSREKLYHRIQ